jgi:two-component system cell cycle sensor histidine kinase/response regulator CckA
MDVEAHAPARQLDTAKADLVLAAFEAAPGGLLVAESGRVLLANSAAAKLLGYEDPASLTSRPVDEFFPGGLFCRELSQGNTDSQCEHPACEWSIRQTAQKEVRIAVHCTRFRSGGRDLVLTAFQETRRAEVGAMLRNGEPRFRAIFEGAAIGIVTSTLDGRIIDSNPALSKMLGYSAEELVGMHAREFHPGDFQEDEALLQQLTLGARECFDLEKRYQSKNGTYLWGHLTVSLVRDSGGQPAFVIAMLEDITERKRNEEQLREAEKMEVIGRVAGGIAHDFNNLLTGILLYCDLVLTGPESEEQWRAHVEEIRLAGEQGAALTQQLLSMARKQAPQPRPIQLNEVISSTENLLRRLVGEQLELVTLLAPNLEPVMADPGQLRQVLLNLVLNARDAMPNGGRITVSTRSKALPGGGDPTVSLLVRDTGIGMDTETRARLFEPFFTTKKPGQGTGLGLTTVQRIVKEASGTIEVESETGRGTRIEVFFPALRHLAATNVPAPSQRTGETILLVDDHAGARHSMQRVLQQAGYRVLHASSGKRGLAVFAEHEADVDLLLADWMMPGMSGRDLAKRLCQLKPGLKVLLISGYQDAPDEPQAQSVDLIRKPFAGSALLGRIREVLNSKGDPPC